MRPIVQVVYRPSLLAVREEILATLGHPVISVLGTQAAQRLNLMLPSPGVIVIGHGAGRLERQELIEFFRRTAPGVPIVALLRQRDKRFDERRLQLPSGQPARVGKNRQACSRRNSVGSGSVLFCAYRKGRRDPFNEISSDAPSNGRT